MDTGTGIGTSRPPSCSGCLNRSAHIGGRYDANASFIQYVIDSWIGGRSASYFRQRSSPAAAQISGNVPGFAIVHQGENAGVTAAQANCIHSGSCEAIFAPYR